MNVTLFTRGREPAATVSRYSAESAGCFMRLDYGADEITIHFDTDNEAIDFACRIEALVGDMLMNDIVMLAKQMEVPSEQI